MEQIASEKCRVSVIVPIYNVAKFVGQCIDSIIKQTYKNLEIILVDDGSPDLSGEICDEFAVKDKRIRVFHNANSGVSNARNFGISVSTGEFICFIDGDDYISNDYIEYFLSLISEYSADAAYSEYYFSMDNEPQSKNEIRKSITGENAAVCQLCYRTNIGVWNKIFRRSLLGEKVRFLPEQYFGEGFNFNVTAFQNAQIVAVGSKKVYYYRQNNNSSATKNFSMAKAINGLKSIDDIKENMVICSKSMQDAWEFAKWRTNADIYIMMVLSETTEIYPQMYQSCKRASKKDALCALKTNTSYKEKVSALLFAVSPRLIFVKINLKNFYIKLLQ